MSFFRDAPELKTTIRTYFVPDNRPVIPYANIFFPLQWDRGNVYPYPGIDYLKYSYYNGADVWGCPGTSFIGTEEQWRLGALTTDPVPTYNLDTLCPVSCGCTFLAGPCGTFPTIPPVYRVSISGCTGSKAGFNGVWDLPYVTGCQWELFIPGAGDYVDVFVFWDGVQNVLLVLVGLSADDGEYTVEDPPNPVGPYVANKTVGGVLFPATIGIEGIA